MRPRSGQDAVLVTHEMLSWLSVHSQVQLSGDISITSSASVGAQFSVSLENVPLTHASVF
jgi:hypothetical protein